jgi:hypothetical protein
MAGAYPNCRFLGYDISRYALHRAEEKRQTADAANVTFHDPRDQPLPDDASIGFITTFDCIHDMTHPFEMMLRPAINHELCISLAQRRQQPKGRVEAGPRRHALPLPS